MQRTALRAAADRERTVADKNMTNVVDHLRPCIPAPPEAVTMTVSLAPFGMPDRYERLIVVPSPQGNYVVACLPFFSYGIRFGDLVELREPGKEFERVLKGAGLRTLRFGFNDPARADEAHKTLHSKLVASGLPHEWHGAGYLAVLLRNVADQERALSCLEEFANVDCGRWEVDPEPFA
jgi:hypothetical protein